MGEARPGPSEKRAVAASGEEVVFTTGAYTVRFEGPSRTFSESKHGITNTVLSATWVHLLPAPFDGTVDAAEVAWLEARVAANAAGEPDVLAQLAQYVEGSADVFDGSGLRVAGDAGYGLAEGADFNDFLQIDWSYPAEGRSDPWDAIDAGNLDCSGYVRIVYGYRGGIPMSWTDQSGDTLPRQAKNLLAYGTGVITIPDRGAPVRARDYAKLQPGDLVFFDAQTADAGIDHVGVFLGIDTEGQYRMINSRSSMLGPTFRDGAGSAYGESGQPSVLSDGSLYSRSFRAARRL